jgi:hypothetical protein
VKTTYRITIELNPAIEAGPLAAIVRNVTGERLPADATIAVAMQREVIICVPVTPEVKQVIAEEILAKVRAQFPHSKPAVVAFVEVQDPQSN